MRMFGRSDRKSVAVEGTPSIFLKRVVSFDG